MIMADVQLGVNASKVISNIFGTNFIINPATEISCFAPKLFDFIENISTPSKNTLYKFVILDRLVCSFESSDSILVLALAAQHDII